MAPQTAHEHHTEVDATVSPASLESESTPEPTTQSDTPAEAQTEPASLGGAPAMGSPLSSASDSSAIALTGSGALRKPKASGNWVVRALRGLGWGLIFATTASVSAALGAAAILLVPAPGQPTAQQPTDPSLGDLWKSGFRYQVSRPVNILIMGIDEVQNVDADSPEVFSGRTDTMLLVRVDPDQGVTNVLSIPRDTRVEIPGHGTFKINQANVEGGAQLAAQTVSQSLDGVQIDRYVRISTSAFRELVDLVGGVDVNVPRPMHYEDQTQGLFIHLEPGWQTLNGDQAEQFARFRKDAYGDIGRVQRQQMLLKSLRERLTSPSLLPKLPQAVRILQRYIDTNLSLEEMLALASFALDMESQNFNMVMLPGRFSSPEEFAASYWLMDPTASDRIMNEFFQTETVTLLSNDDVPSIARMRVAVQNASGDPHAGQEVARYLRDQGFYNVYVTQDWGDVNTTTQIIAQRGDLQSAEVVSSTLGLGRVMAESTGDLDSDFTVRIGQDWVTQHPEDGVVSGEHLPTVSEIH